MKLTQPSIVLGLVGGILLAVGLALLFWPGAMLGLMDVQLPTARARSEIRAIYAGLEMGVGIYLLSRVKKPLVAQFEALTAGGIAMVSVGLARGLSVGFTDPTDALSWVFASAEFLGGVLCLVAREKTRY